MQFFSSFDSYDVRVYFHIKISNFDKDPPNMMMMKHISDVIARIYWENEDWRSEVLYEMIPKSLDIDTFFDRVKSRKFFV